MPDIYLEYCAWFQHMYGRPFNVTREEWSRWCRAKPAPRQSDIDFDYAKEREGDAQ
jgi:hypothetical protein